jgi:hypothetical protein
LLLACLGKLFDREGGSTLLPNDRKHVCHISGESNSSQSPQWGQSFPHASLGLGRNPPTPSTRDEHSRLVMLYMTHIRANSSNITAYPSQNLDGEP